jgi:hypothetical protein
MLALQWSDIGLRRPQPGIDRFGAPLMALVSVGIKPLYKQPVVGDVMFFGTESKRHRWKVKTPS